MRVIVRSLLSRTARITRTAHRPYPHPPERGELGEITDDLYAQDAYKIKPGGAARLDFVCFSVYNVRTREVYE